MEIIQENAEGNFTYGKIICLIFQGEGGNIKPYKKHLARLGLFQNSSTMPVETIEIKGLGKEETIQKFDEIEQSVQAEFNSSGKGTFIHVYV